MPKAEAEAESETQSESVDQSLNSSTGGEAEPQEKKGGGAPSSAGSVADLTQIADDLITSQPEVQEHAIAQESAQDDERAAQYADLRDRDGNPFDPAIHKTNGAGEPTVSTLGKLIKKPGRKPAQKPGAGGSTVGGVSPGDGGQAAQVRAQARASGTLSANLLIQIGIVAGGEEWHPRVNADIGLDEKTMLENAFADYFEATGKTDIPPGLALTVAVGAYTLPRFTMPKTRGRIAKARDAIKKWWINRKLKKHGMKAEPIQPSEKRDN